MMVYTQRQVMDAFSVYARLATRGELERKDAADYYEDDVVRSLVERFAQEVQCTIISDRVNLYLLPVAQNSPFHITNDTFKKLYLPSKALNLDIYMMYLAVIVLFGRFYDSYQSFEAADFVAVESWLEGMDERIAALRNYPEERLAALDQEYDFNWSALVLKWSDMDDLKETVKRQGQQSDRFFEYDERVFEITEPAC